MTEHLCIEHIVPIMALHSLAAEENAVAWRGVEEREEDHLARDLARDEVMNISYDLEA